MDKTYTERARECVAEIKAALQEVYSALNQGQQKKLLRNPTKEIKEDVKAITGKAGKRWDGLVDKALAALAGAFIAWLLSGAVG